MEVTKVVTEEVEVTKVVTEEVEVTKVVTEEVPVEVTKIVTEEVAMEQLPSIGGGQPQLIHGLAGRVRAAVAQQRSVGC